MIKQVSITNENGEKIDILLGDVEPSSGLFITSIEGLGPVKADINMKDTVYTDGSKFNIAKANSRNIVLHVRFIEAKTIEEVRHLTYKYFPLKKRIRFDIVTDLRRAYAYGYIESNDPDIFTSAESATISILCESAWFRDSSPDGEQQMTFSDIVSLFEFEFADDDSPSIEFSSVEVKRENEIFYNGEADTGFTMHIEAAGSYTNPVIFNNETGESFRIKTDKIASIVGSNIIPGDNIVISTFSGQKYVKLIRNGIEYNILNSVDKNVDWLTLHPGLNKFSYTADSGELNIRFKVEVPVLYQGV